MMLIFTQPAANASYISDGTLVILRSQFVDDTAATVINGNLNDPMWDKAGSFTISFTQPEDITITVYFTNNNEWLYFGIRGTDFAENFHDSLLLAFDTEGDGSLDSPEDGVSVVGTSINDFYWNGESWVIDPESGDSDFTGSSRRTNGMREIEFRKALTPSKVVYDGFRISNPSNTFISFSFQYIETRKINDTHVEPIVFTFPSAVSNATGFIDLKLAGPEDQDLPEFIPPETFTQTQTQTDGSVFPPVDTVVDTLEAALGPSYGMIIFLIPIAGIAAHRRRRS